MSTLKATYLQQASSASPNITLDAFGNALVNNATLSPTGSSTNTGNIALTGTVAMGSSFKRNRIINGDMRIDQRNAGASVTPSTGTYTLDRWNAYSSAASKYTVQQNAGSVTPPVGFTKYLGCTSSSAYSVTSSDLFCVYQRIEGFNVADLAWGTVNARTITLSFWVYSSLTGTFAGSLQNSAAIRSYPFTYTISSSNTWTQITLTIAGDTTGTWATDNTSGIQVTFSFGAGSTYNATANTWSASQAYSVTGATSIVGTNGATFYITGVQLEVGSVATPYERQIYSDQLAQCQRYYQLGGLGAGSTFPTTSGNIGNPITLTTTTFGPANVVFNPVMRATPTVRTADSAGTIGNARNYSAGTNIAITTDVRALAITSIGVTGQTVGNIVCFQYDASAEL